MVSCSWAYLLRSIAFPSSLNIFAVALKLVAWSVNVFLGVTAWICEDFHAQNARTMGYFNMYCTNRWARKTKSHLFWLLFPAAALNERKTSKLVYANGPWELACLAYDIGCICGIIGVSALLLQYWHSSRTFLYNKRSRLIWNTLLILLMIPAWKQWDCS